MEPILSGPIQPEPSLLQSVEELRKLPQVPMPLEQRFQDGVYLREIFMPADTYVIGHVHRHAHWNMILTGRALVSFDGRMQEVKAGDVIHSGPGAQKMLYIIEDCRWMTVHSNPTNCTDIAKLEEDIAVLDPETLEQKGGMTLDEFRIASSKALTA